MLEARGREAQLLWDQLGQARAQLDLARRENEIYGEFVEFVNERTEDRPRSEVARWCQQAMGEMSVKMRGLRKTWSERVTECTSAYRHYKNGRLYRIVRSVKDAEYEGREVLVYEDIETGFGYVRSGESFFASIECEGESVRRFRLEGDASPGSLGAMPGEVPVIEAPVYLREKSPETAPTGVADHSV